MMDVNQFGKALQGAGAWFAGQGPQYQVAQAREVEAEAVRQAAEQKRMDEIKTRLAGGLRFALTKQMAGDDDAARQVLQAQVPFMQSQGIDPANILAMIEADPAARLAALTQAHNTSVSLGLAEPIEARATSVQTSGDFAIITGPSGEVEVKSLRELAGMEGDKFLKDNGEGMGLYQRPDGSVYLRRLEGADTGDAAPDPAQVNALRDSYSKGTADLRDVRASYNVLKGALEKGTAAGDLSAIFAFMKMIDPGSTVREGEMATAANATGVPNRIVNLYNQALKGVKLDPEQRKEFMATGKGLLDAQQAAADETMFTIWQQSKADKINPRLVFGKQDFAAWRRRWNTHPNNTKRTKQGREKVENVIDYSQISGGVPLRSAGN